MLFTHGGGFQPEKSEGTQVIHQRKAIVAGVSNAASDNASRFHASLRRFAIRIVGMRPVARGYCNDSPAKVA
ncbi:MAG: hypothetical protein RR831_08855 [Stenotrophomonas sp.]